MIVALHLPMLEFSATTPPGVDYFVGTGLMGMFLWTVGSFDVFGEQWDLTLFFPVRSRCFKSTHISMLIVYLQRSMIERRLFVQRFVFVEIPIVEIRWAG